MPEYLLRFEITNLKNTIFDVHDISSIRGSSFAALKAPRLLYKFLQTVNKVEEVEMLFEGGSQGIYRLVTSSADEKDIEVEIKNWWGLGSLDTSGKPAKKRSFPLKYLQYTLAVLPWADEPRVQKILLKKSGAICKWKQFNLPSFILPERKRGLGPEPDTPYCDIDRARPAVEEWPIYGDTVRNGEPAKEPEKTLHLSSYIYHRRDYGSSLRPRQLYKEILGRDPFFDCPENDYYFTDSFEQIVSQPKEGFSPQLPVSLENKMAVVFFDVNGLGKMHREIDSVAELGKLSELVQKQRKDILSSVLDKLCDKGHFDRWLYSGRNWKNQKKEMIRFETLLWGSDEFSWVMPSWLAWDFLEAFFQHSRLTLSRNREETVLGHSGGMVVCNRKMPIRKVRQLADDLRESAKKGMVNENSTIQIEILESIDIPDGHLEQQRRNLFGPKAGQRDGLFTLDGDEWEELTRQIAKLKFTLPRTQLRRILQHAANTPQNEDHLRQAEKQVVNRLEELLADNSYLDADGTSLLTLDDFEAPLWDRNNNSSVGNGSYLMALYHLDRLWDYVQPFCELNDDNLQRSGEQ